MSDPQVCQLWNHDPVSDVIHRLLQLSDGWTPSIYLVSSPEGPECSSSAYSWPQSTIPHHFCSATTPLVTSEILDHPQSFYAHAQHFPQLCRSYLSSLITFCSSDPHHHQLRSSTVRSAMVSHTRIQFGRRSYSVGGPDIWDNLPTNLRLIDSHAAFQRVLKTHLFNTAFIS